MSGWRKCVVNATQNAIPIPAISASLAFFDGFTSKKLPMNLLQAMRDYFGAHTVQLQGNPGVSIHLRWG
jgi:6-phosphogluconate dehydrogenase